MNRKLLTTAAIAAMALTAVAGSAAAGANSGAHASGSKTIKLLNASFSPKKVTVSKGTTLRFVWTGNRPHNLRGPGVNVSSRVGGSKSVKARTGTYVCDIHSGMKVAVKVR
jgi:plastocyanin